jgi:hypothetical protein
MLHSTFIFSLLACTASARSVPRAAALPADSSLPSFALVTPGATIEPPSSLAPIVTPTPTPTPIDNDQPAPYDSTLQIPASQSFNPSDAPAFTPRPGTPNPSSNPVFPSTPCSTEAAPTAAPEYPIGTPSLALPSEIPTPKVPSNGEAPSVSASSAKLPATTPTPASGEKPCTSSYPAIPIFSGTPSSINFPSFPTGSQTSKPFPTAPGRPGDRLAYGWGRPRPTGAWPSRGAAGPHYPHPSAGLPLPPRPSAGFGASKGNAATTPCTLETRVRPTPTVAL